MSEPTCTCGRIKIGSEITNTRNWNPDCEEHGVDTEWWNSGEGAARREAQNARLRDLRRQVAEARKGTLNVEKNSPKNPPQIPETPK